MSVIITHARARNALAATRCLGRRGIKVVTADSIYPSTSFFSRYSSSYFEYINFRENPELFIKSIKNYLKKNNSQVLMPMYEETFVISKYRDAFGNNIKIPLIDHEKLMKINNKRYLMDFAEEIGVKIPQTYKIDEIHELKEVIKKVEFPAVIKLVKGGGSVGIRYVHSEDELLMEYKKLIIKFNLGSSEYPLIQEYIPGTGYGVSMLFNKGDPRAIFTHKRIREYPITGGPSTARISVRHAKMEKYATMLLKEFGWHGVAMVEFKLDDRTKEPVLMEINPRFWGSLNQAICAGVDFPYLLFKMSIEGDVKPVFSYKVGVKTRWLPGDVRAFIDYIRTDNIRMDKRREALKDFFKLYDPNLYYDDIVLNDPIPAIAEFMVPVINYIKKGKFKFVPEVER